MDARWGKIIYWAATTIAVLIVAVVVVGYASNASEDWPVIPVIPLLIAGTIWLVGWALRHLLAVR
jgi:type VI protein secretion system component VasK